MCFTPMPRLFLKIASEARNDVRHNTRLNKDIQEHAQIQNNVKLPIILL